MWYTVLMPYKNKEQHKAAQNAWAKRNAPYMADVKKQIRIRNSQYVVDKKKNVPCMDCGEKYPHYVMDYDHRPGVVKIDKINRLCNRGVSLKKIQTEIDKCDLVCANCHRSRTYERLEVKYDLLG